MADIVKPAEPKKSRGRNPPCGRNNPGNGKARARGATLDKRLDTVEEWLAKGWTRSAMAREAKKLWDVQPRTLSDYTAAVKRRMSEEQKAGRDEARFRQDLRLNRAASKILGAKKPNWFAYLGVEQAIAALHGTKYQPGDELPKTGDQTVEIEIDPPEGAEEPQESEPATALAAPAKAPGAAA